MKLNQVSTTRITFYALQDGAQARAGDEGAQEVTFELRRFSGRDQREFSDLANRFDKRGRPMAAVGGIFREKVVRAVVSVSGLEDREGNPITRFTAEVFDGLPAWMTDALLHEVNELNGFDEGE